jgi:hypothetical protein
MTWLLVRHVRLKAALRALLGDAGSLEAGDVAGVGDGAVVVTTVSDMKPSACAALARRGVRVIVLGTGLPGPGEAEYRAAGAYLYREMNLGAGKLTGWLRAAVDAGKDAPPPPSSDGAAAGL